MSDEQQIEDVSKVVVESNHAFRNAFALTALYLMLVGLFLYSKYPEWFGNFGANEFGDLLAGIFAPVAFGWLVLGFVQQGRELRAQVAQLNDTAKAAMEQSEQQTIGNELGKSELASRHYEKYIASQSSVMTELLRELYVLLYGDTEQGRDEALKKQGELWSEFHDGNRSVFARELSIFLVGLLSDLSDAEMWSEFAQHAEKWRRYLDFMEEEHNHWRGRIDRVDPSGLHFGSGHNLILDKAITDLKDFVHHLRNYEKEQTNG